MFFPHMVGAFICDQSANEVLKSLLIILENNKDLNFKIVSKNPNGLSCQLRTSHLLEHNSFLPHIDITIFDINGHTHGIINYSLQTSAKILLTIFCGLYTRTASGRAARI